MTLLAAEERGRLERNESAAGATRDVLEADCFDEREYQEGPIGAVVPLKSWGGRWEGSLGRSELLLETLQRYAPPGFFDPIVFVTPSDEVVLTEELLAARFPHLAWRVIDECRLLPDLDGYPSVSGWHKQQALKLGACLAVDRPYYMTFDPDVVCVHKLSRELLLPGGRAIVQLADKRRDPGCWRSSAHMLRLDSELDVPGMSATPALKSTAICRGLLTHLSRRDRKGSWLRFLLNRQRNLRPRRWIPIWRDNRDNWSGNSLYFLFAQATDILERYHRIFPTEERSPRLISDNSFWNETPFDSWSPDPCLEDGSLFCVIQGNKELAVTQVRAKLPRLFEALDHT